MDFGDAELYVTTEFDPARARLTAHLLYGSPRWAHARFLDDPARIVVDTRPAPGPVGVDLSPSGDRSTWVLTEPALWDGTVPGTNHGDHEHGAEQVGRSHLVPPDGGCPVGSPPSSAGSVTPR